MGARATRLTQKMKPKTRSTAPATLEARSGMKPGLAAGTAAARGSSSLEITVGSLAAAMAPQVEGEERDGDEDGRDPADAHGLEGDGRRIGWVETHAGEQEAAQAGLLLGRGHPSGLGARQ